MSNTPTSAVTLPRNRRTWWVVLVLCLAGSVPLAACVQMVLTAESFNRMFLGMLLSVVLTCVFVIGPLAYLWFVLTFGVRVSPTGVRWLRRGQVEREIAFADLTEVWANTGSRGPMGTIVRSVTLNGTDAAGEPLQIHVGRALVASLTPLLDAVAAEVARRPSLLGDDPDSFRTLLAEER